MNKIYSIRCRIVFILMILACIKNANGQLYITKTDARCNGYWGTVIVDSVKGIATPEYYLVQPGGIFSQQASFSLSAGTYTISAFDRNGNKKSKAFTILEPDSLLIDTLIATNPTCKPISYGTVQVIAKGGTPPYIYFYGGTSNGLWNTFNNLGAGLQSFTVKDSNGCNSFSNQGFKTVELSFDRKTRFDSVVTNLLSCANDTNGNIHIYASLGLKDSQGNFNYSSTNTNLKYTLSNSGFTSPQENYTGVFSNLRKGNYICHVNDTSGCTSVQNSVGIYAITNIGARATNNGIIYNLSTQSVELGCVDSTKVEILGPTNITYAVQLLNQHNQIVYQGTTTKEFDFWPTPGESYRLLFSTAIGCTSDTLLFHFPNRMPLSFTLDSMTSPCAANNTNYIHISGNGGTQPYTFTANKLETLSSGIFGGFQCSSQFFELKDSFGCKIDTVIDFGCNLSISPLSVQDVSCNLNGYILMDTSKPNLSYTLNVGPFTVGNSTGFFSPLSGADYTVVATDANTNCMSSTAVSLQPFSPFLDIVTKSVSCMNRTDGAMYVTVAGLAASETVDSLTCQRFDKANGTYGHPIIFADSIVGLDTGLYQIRAYINGACVLTSSNSIEPLNQLYEFVPYVVDENCLTQDKGIIALQNDQQNSYFNFSKDSVNWNNQPYVSNLNQGLQRIFIRELVYDGTSNSYHYCYSKFDTMIGIRQNLKLDSAEVQHISCFYKDDGIITLNNSNLNYSIAPTAGVAAAPNQFTNMPAGYYIIEGYRLNGCRADTAIVISAAKPIVLQSEIENSNAACYGSIVANAYGGEGIYNYELVPKAGTKTADNQFDNLCWGTYQIIATDANGCLQSQSVVINEDLDAPENIFDRFEVYPNPVRDVLFIRSDILIGYQILLYNLEGKLLRTKVVKSKMEQLDLNELKSGIYLLKLATDLDIKQYKITVLR